MTLRILRSSMSWNGQSTNTEQINVNIFRAKETSLSTSRKQETRKISFAAVRFWAARCSLLIFRVQKRNSSPRLPGRLCSASCPCWKSNAAFLQWLKERLSAAPPRCHRGLLLCPRTEILEPAPGRSTRTKGACAGAQRSFQPRPRGEQGQSPAVAAGSQCLCRPPHRATTVESGEPRAALGRQGGHPGPAATSMCEAQPCCHLCVPTGKAPCHQHASARRGCALKGALWHPRVLLKPFGNSRSAQLFREGTYNK